MRCVLADAAAGCRRVSLLVPPLSSPAPCLVQCCLQVRLMQHKFLNDSAGRMVKVMKAGASQAAGKAKGTRSFLGA
jgi:hypothetical protein